MNPALCYVWSWSSGCRVFLSLLAETIYVGRCPTSIALAPAFRVSCVRIPNYFVRSKLDLFYPEGKYLCLLISKCILDTFFFQQQLLITAWLWQTALFSTYSFLIHFCFTICGSIIFTCPDIVGFSHILLWLLQRYTEAF